MRLVANFTTFLVCLTAVAAPLRAEPVLQAVMSAPTLRVEQNILDRAALEAVYAPRNFDPIWLKDKKLAPSAEAVLATLSEAAQHGLVVKDYHVDEINARLKSEEWSEKVVLDLLITDGFMRYVADLKVGRVSPRQLKGEKYQRQQMVDPAEIVSQTLAAPDTKAYLASLPPASPVYHGLVKVLATLRAQQAAGGWPQLPDGPKLESGKSSDRIVKLRQRLAASGELGQAAPEGRLYDPALVAAVKAFQIRHGLEADGVIGRNTRNVFNETVETRINQVLANMERLRWQPPQFGERYIIVNVPAFELTAFDNGQPALHMSTITGRPARKTPIFSDNIRYLEFNPNWHVPPTIVKEDILPHLREDPTYALEHKNVRIYQDGVEIDPTTVDWKHVGVHDYRMRAPPGPRNPLGTVKFMFPNPFDVYLHDTSEPNLFKEDVRALSSGCVRVADPAALTNWILSTKTGWSDEKRLKILESGKQTRVELPAPVPVYLIYVTAWLGADALPVFRSDIYSYDSELAAAINDVESKPRRLITSMVRGSSGQPQLDPIVNPKEPVEKAEP